MGHRRGRRRRVGVLIAALAAVTIAAMLLPDRIPDTWGLALVGEAFLPWLGVPVALLLIAALARRAWLGIIVTLVAVVVWSWLFVPRIMPLDAATGGSATATVTVLSQNLHGAAGDPGASVSGALALSPDLLALQEIDADAREALGQSLQATYPHTASASTVGLWSRFPIRDAEPLDLGLGWPRALRAVVATPGGDTTVYVVHAASARLQGHDARDRMLGEFADRLRADRSPRIIALGDFNAGPDDRAFAPLLEILHAPRHTSGGFGFSWPAKFPLVRLDHILVRGLDPRANDTVVLGASDHRAVTAELAITP